MLGRLVGAHLRRSLQLSDVNPAVFGPTNGARTLAAFAGNFGRSNVGYAPPPPQEEPQPAPSQAEGSGLREVPFSKEIANTVKLMGRLGRDPEMKRLETGRVVTKMPMAISKPKSQDGLEEAEWIDIETWDSPEKQLATMAANSLRKGSRIAVQGRLRIDQWQDNSTGQKRTKAKIIADDLALVTDSQGMDYSQQPSSFASPSNNSAAGGSSYTQAPNSSAPPARKAPEDNNAMWESYFGNPDQWWDNRQNKRNPRAPDFVHKETREALWIDDRRTPPFVLTRLSEEQPPAGPELDVSLEELWKNLYEDPGSWWDNRKTKRTQDAPDFVHKDTKQGLVINNPEAPDYLVSPEALADLDQRFVLVANMEAEEYMELWEDLFANLQNWYDNRQSKKNPRAPDFVNKENRDVVLWLNDKRNSPELLSRVEGAIPSRQAYGGQ